MDAALASNSTLRSETRHFHLWMAAAFILIAFGGFMPSYWARVAQGTFHQPPVIHIHGILLFGLTLCSIVAAKITTMQIDDVNGFGDASRRFSAVAFGVLLVLGAMIYDWRTRGRPHKVYVYGALLLSVEPLLAVWIAGTASWMTAARFLQHLAG